MVDDWWKEIRDGRTPHTREDGEILSAHKVGKTCSGTPLKAVSMLVVPKARNTGDPNLGLRIAIVCTFQSCNLTFYVNLDRSDNGHEFISGQNHCY